MLATGGVTTGVQQAERNQEATLWVGGLDPSVSEELLYELFLQCGPVTSVHIPKDKVTAQQANYAFVEFASAADADYASRVLSNVRLCGKPLRINRAAADKQGDEGYHAKLFIGNLDAEVDEKLLYDTFAQFGPVLSAKVMTEADSDASRGFRLHPVRLVPQRRRGHRGHERPVPLQQTPARLLRVQAGQQGREARQRGGARAGAEEQREEGHCRGAAAEQTPTPSLRPHAEHRQGDAAADDDAAAPAYPWSVPYGVLSSPSPSSSPYAWGLPRLPPQPDAADDADADAAAVPLRDDATSTSDPVCHAAGCTGLPHVRWTHAAAAHASTCCSIGVMSQSSPHTVQSQLLAITAAYSSRALLEGSWTLPSRASRP